MVNLGSRECRKRFVLGVAMLAVGFGIAAALILTDANPWWRISLVLPFWIRP